MRKKVLTLAFEGRLKGRKEKALKLLQRDNTIPALFTPPFLFSIHLQYSTLFSPPLSSKLSLSHQQISFVLFCIVMLLILEQRLSNYLPLLYWTITQSTKIH